MVSFITGMVKSGPLIMKTVFTDVFVNVDGDNMTGDLTLGTDKITLDATVGSATFASNGSFLSDNFKINQPGGDIAFSLRDEVAPDPAYIPIEARVVGYQSSASRGRLLIKSTDSYTEDAQALAIDDSISLNYDGSATFTGDVQMASQNGGPLAGFRNQIINGDFRIWQRGNAITLSGAEYHADRWFTGEPVGTISKVSKYGGILCMRMLSYTIHSASNRITT